MIEIRTATREDIPSLKMLLESTFGKFETIRDVLEKWLTQPDFFVSIALKNGTAVGICTWTSKPDGDFSKYETFGASAMAFLTGKRAAWILNLAVVPEERKKGLGFRLAAHARKWLDAKDCEIVVGLSWVSGSEDNSSWLYRNAGFQALGESTDYLRAEMRNRIECIRCKTTECRCKTILFGTEYAALKRLEAGI